MTSFHDDRKKMDAVKSFPRSAESVVILDEAFEGLEHALLFFDAGGKLISANARAREVLDLPGNGVQVEASHQEHKPDDRHQTFEWLAGATRLAEGDRFFVWPSARSMLDGFPIRQL